MISERQRIEAPPAPSVENNMPPPPPYEEVNGVYASQSHNGLTDGMGYFLGEVNNLVPSVITYKLANIKMKRLLLQPLILMLNVYICCSTIGYAFLSS